MVDFLILCGLIAAAAYGRHKWRIYSLHRLRRNPPAKAFYAVALPYDATGSTEATGRVWASLGALLNADHRARAAGECTFEIDLVATRESWDKPVEVVVMVRHDPAETKRVQQRISQRLPTAEFLILDEDPLAELHAQLLRQEEAQKQAKASNAEAV